MTNRDGGVVSVKDGRPLKEGNNLKLTYSNNYCDDLNTRKFYGRYLTLGEAYKLAVVCHYDPKLPTDKEGIMIHVQLCFRQQPITPMSVQGQPRIPRFFELFVQSAKQLWYAWLTRARFYFGDSVFRVKRPAKQHQSKCFIISI